MQWPCLRGCPPHLSPAFQNERECSYSVSGMQLHKRRVDFHMVQLCASQNCLSAKPKIHRGFAWGNGMGETGSCTVFPCMQKTETNVPAENMLRAFETMWRWQKMFDAGLLFFLWVVWGTLLQAIIIAIWFFMSVFNIYFILLLLSLLWLGYTVSSLGLLRLFTEFTMWRAIEYE